MQSESIKFQIENDSKVDYFIENIKKNDQKMLLKNHIVDMMSKKEDIRNITSTHIQCINALFNFLKEFNVDITSIEVCKFYIQFLTQDFTIQYLIGKYALKISPENKNEDDENESKDNLKSEDKDKDENIEYYLEEIIDVVFDFFIKENNVFMRELFKDSEMTYLWSLNDINEKFLSFIYSKHLIISAFLKPVNISKELAMFLNLDDQKKYTRVEITKSICEYIKTNSLVNPEDKRIIIPDNRLRLLLNYKESESLTYFKLQKYIQHHFTKDNNQVKPSELSLLLKKHSFIDSSLTSLLFMKFNFLKVISNVENKNENNDTQDLILSYNMLIRNSISYLTRQVSPENISIINIYILSVLNLTE